MTVTLSRLFDAYSEAQAAIARLENAGIDEADISVIANNSDKWFSPDLAGAAGKGAAVGAGFGGVGGLLAGLGLLAVPGLGPLVAAGWLVAAVGGAAVAGVAGSAIGMLAEAGVATNDAEVYAESIRRGGSLVSVRVADQDRDRIDAILHPSSVDIAQRREMLKSSGWKGFDTSPAKSDRADAPPKQDGPAQTEST